MDLILAPDIIERIQQEYEKQYDLVEGLLINQSFFHKDEIFKLRLIRSILFLSEGSIERLQYYLNIANVDYRDLFYWAEYDQQSKQVRDFSKPFNNN
ncbi:hypothetical protein [Cohnella sp.]|uniref:hypothetical protein n=1 Tax=Cohnella sp. TaxID=1883426 RepID=UPI0035630A40